MRCLGQGDSVGLRLRRHQQQQMVSGLQLTCVILSSVYFGFLAQSTSVQADSYSAAFKDISCYSDVVLQPSSTADVAAFVSKQVKAAAADQKGLKVRATHSAFHSSASFPCPGPKFSVFPPITKNTPWPSPDADKGSPAATNTTSVSLLLDNMSRVLSVDHAKYQMRVQAGMLLSSMLKEASSANMSVPLGCLPSFGDLTLGGVLATGAHGTGYNTTSTLGDIVAEITWVDGGGAEHVSPRNSTAGQALVAGLGVAGIVTELLLQLQPQSHTQVDTRYKVWDGNLLADVKQMLKETPHVLIVWRPDLRQYTSHMTKQVDVSVPKLGGILDLLLPRIAAEALGWSLAAWQADRDDKLPLTAVPILAAVHEISVGHVLANLYNGQKMFAGAGDTNDMQVASCGNKCLWDMGANIAMDDVHLSIELNGLGDWIQDVQQVISADLWDNGRKRHRFLSPGYFWFRFGHGSGDFLSHTSGMKSPVHVQLSFMKALHNPLVPSKYGWVLDILEQLTLCKYRARPHWGKNHQRTFTHPSCHVKDRLPLWDQMMAFKATTDPQSIFEPHLFTDMANKVPYSYSPGCNLRGECFCTADEHCAPGFQCLPSVAFPEYKACVLPPEQDT